MASSSTTGGLYEGSHMKDRPGMDLIRWRWAQRGPRGAGASSPARSARAGQQRGFARDFYYHSSFIIADHRCLGAETAGQQGRRAGPRHPHHLERHTIGSEWDCSNDLVNYAADRWCKGRDDFHFARCYSDFVYDVRRSRAPVPHNGRAQARKRYVGRVGDCALRDLGCQPGPDWTPA